jgi:hypothetical protein
LVIVDYRSKILLNNSNLLQTRFTLFIIKHIAPFLQTVTDEGQVIICGVEVVVVVVVVVVGVVINTVSQKVPEYPVGQAKIKLNNKYL